MQNITNMAEISNLECKYPIHIGPLFMCSYCKMMYISEEFLDKHQKKCILMKLHLLLKIKLQLKRKTLNEGTGGHPTKNKNSEDYICDECFCDFLKLSDYESHMRDRHPEKLFHCDQCDRNFPYEIKLRRHIYIAHRREKPYKCDICSKLFRKKSQMVIHNRSHSGERPFSCDHCDKSFVHKGHLNRHLLTHSGKKPFGCDHCGKRFSQKGDFNRHFLIHSGEKPFGCDQCKKRFSQKSNLNKHLRIHLIRS